jgi:hypothetical protein
MDQIEAGSVMNETKKALDPAIKGCAEQIGLLDQILAKVLPISTDSLLVKGKKAILSLQQEAKIEKIMKTLRSYVGTLTFYYASISSRLQPLTGITFSRAYIASLLTSNLRCKAHSNSSVALAAKSIPQLPEST